MDKLSIAQAQQITDETILEYLKESWGISDNEDIRVWGTLNIGTNYQTKKNFYKLKNIKTKNDFFID